MKITPVTRDHLAELYETLPAPSLRGFAVVDGDRTLGIGGFYHAGGATAAFMRLTDEIRKKPRWVFRLTQAMRTVAPRTAVALCDETIEAAPRFLAHFGFEDRGDGVWVHHG